MLRTLLLLGVLAAAWSPSQAQDRVLLYDRWFSAATMRVDYFHTGGLNTESVALDRVLDDGPWPGSRTTLLDTSGLGGYVFRVDDAATRTAIYSKGFSSIFAEWITSAEVSSTHRTFHESIRFPWPKVAVRVTLEARESGGTLREVWSTVLDPALVDVTQTRVAAPAAVWSMWESGPTSTKVDLLLVPAGYTASQLPKYHVDAARLIEAMFSVEPYKSRRTDFNVRGLDIAADQAGVSRPHQGVYRRDALGVEYNIFGTDRYMLATNNRALRDLASAAPYDAIEVLVNEKIYGGGGIFNAHATVAVDGPAAPAVFVHEFAHHFAGLADEYYGASVAYRTGQRQPSEPWEPNVTALADPTALKWRDMATTGVPIPTPWDRAAYDRVVKSFQDRPVTLRKSGTPVVDLNGMANEERTALSQLLANERHAAAVGAFEGAAYEPTALYRPSLRCVMFSRDDADFCKVCQRAISRAIDRHGAGQP